MAKKNPNLDRTKTVVRNRDLKNARLKKELGISEDTFRRQVPLRGSKTKLVSIAALSERARIVERRRLLLALTPSVNMKSIQAPDRTLIKNIVQRPRSVPHIPKRHNQNYSDYERAQCLHLRFGRVEPPFCEPKRSLSEIFRLLRRPRQSIHQIINAMMETGVYVDGRKCRPRRHPQLTREIEDQICNGDVLYSQRHLSLPE